MYRIVRNDEDIDELLNVVLEHIHETGTKFRGMSYEQGIEAAINWLTDAAYEHPMTD